MPSPRRGGHAAGAPEAVPPLPWIAVAFLLALAVRLPFALLVPAPPVFSDASGYDAAARRLIATGSYAFPVGRALWSDDVFAESAWPAYLSMPPNAWSMPGYTVFLGAAYRVAGVGPRRFAAVRLAQAALGALSAALAFLVAWALLGGRAAWVALILNAAYPPSVRATQYLLTETTFTGLMMTQVALMVWAARSRRPSAFAALGAVTAAAAYVRPVALVLPLALAAFEIHRLWREPAAPASLARLAGRFAMMGLVVALLMAPWWGRNHRLYGVFMPTTSAAALPPVQGELFARGLPVPDESYAQYAIPALTGNDDHVYAVKVARRIRALMPPSHAGLAAAELARARMLASALTTPFALTTNAAPVLSAPFFIQAALLTLALLGLWRHRRQAGVVLILGGAALAIVAVHWHVTMLFPRYLYPAMPLLLVMAAAGLVAPRERAGTGGRGPGAHG